MVFFRAVGANFFGVLGVNRNFLALQISPQKSSNGNMTFSLPCPKRTYISMIVITGKAPVVTRV